MDHDDEGDPGENVKLIEQRWPIAAGALTKWLFSACAQVSMCSICMSSRAGIMDLNVACLPFNHFRSFLVNSLVVSMFTTMMAPIVAFELQRIKDTAALNE